jgi:hypothetical protein
MRVVVPQFSIEKPAEQPRVMAYQTSVNLKGLGVGVLSNNKCYHAVEHVTALVRARQRILFHVALTVEALRLRSSRVDHLIATVRGALGFLPPTRPSRFPVVSGVRSRRERYCGAVEIVARLAIRALALGNLDGSEVQWVRKEVVASRQDESESKFGVSSLALTPAVSPRDDPRGKVCETSELISRFFVKIDIVYLLMLLHIVPSYTLSASLALPLAM